MPPTKKERELQRWKDRIRAAMRAQEEFGNSRDWERWEKYYLGSYTADLPMNYTFALARAKTPQVYFRNPKVVPVARRPDKEAGARVLDAVDDLLIQEMALKSQMKMAILDNFIYGVWVAKIGYDSEYGFSPENLGDEMVTEEGAFDLSSGTLTMRNEKMERLEYNANIRHGMPWVLRVHPKEFLIAPEAMDIPQAQWVTHRVLRRLTDIKEDEKYENKADLKPNYSEEYRTLDEARMIRADKFIPRTQDPETSRPQAERDDDWVELFEIRDAKSQRVIVISLKHDKFLRHEHDELQIDGLPFVSATFNPNPKSFWGVPDAQIINPQQLELNEVRARQQDYRRLNLKRFLTKSGTITPEEKEKFLGELMNPFVDVEASTGESIDSRIKAIQGVIPPDLSIWGAEVVKDMRELVGIGRNQLGEIESSRTTATEAGIIHQNTRIRVDEGRDTMADALSTIMRRVNQLIFKFWTKEQVVKVVGADGLAHWVSYTGPDLQGEYDYKIEPDDALPMTRERRRSEALALYQALGQDPTVNHIELVKHVIRQFEGVSADLLVQDQMAPQGDVMGVDEFGQLQPPVMGGPPGAAIPDVLPSMQMGG